jgi:hypothetical protein
MVFGSAVHAALETMFKPLVKDEELAPLKQVIAKFEKSLKREIITSEDLERRLAYGRKVISNYYQEIKQEQLVSIQPLFIERFFGHGWSKTYLGDIHLTGRIDRVDWLDQEKRLVRVIDYKTGKARSKNYIEGKIASANLSEREQALPETIRGPYKRQLLFYKLLTDLDETFIPTVSEGMFDFVEPNRSGNFMQRNFVLNDEAVADLKDLIKQVMAEIRALEFLRLESNS